MFFNLTNKTHVLFSSALRFFYFVYFSFIFPSSRPALWDLKKTKCENGRIGISTSKLLNLTNKTHVLFSSALRFFVFRLFFVYFSLVKTGPQVPVLCFQSCFWEMYRFPNLCTRYKVVRSLRKNRCYVYRSARRRGTSYLDTAKERRTVLSHMGEGRGVGIAMHLVATGRDITLRLEAVLGAGGKRMGNAGGSSVRDMENARRGERI